MLFMPPRHGKSELASIRFPAWYLGKNPDKEIISCSYNDELADEFGRKTRNVLRDEWYNIIFPDTNLAKDSKRIDRWSTEQGGGYVASGVGGAITGRGADLLIIDDPVKNREEADSDSYQERVWDWFSSTAYTRLHPDGAVIIILTRWNDGDLAGRLLEREPDKWDVVSFPAIAEEDEPLRKKGEALWPSRYNLESLESIKKTIGIKDWASLYQQDPVSGEAQEFKDEWFQKWNTLPKPMRIMTTVDPAISKKKSADDSVVMTCGITPDRKIYVIEYTVGKMNPTELIATIWEHKKKHKPEKVGIEATAYQQSLIHYISQDMKARNEFFLVEPLNFRIDKHARIRGLLPFYQHGQIFHPFDSEELENQLRRFPSGRKDDICDALSAQLELLKAPSFHNQRGMPQMEYDPTTGYIIGHKQAEESIMNNRFIYH